MKVVAALVLVLVLASGLAAATPAVGATIGIADQQPEAFADGRLRALGLRHARLIVPWDGAVSEPARVRAWLDATAAAGLAPHVAFEHLRSDRCPGLPCAAPTRGQYRAAADAFRSRFPEVRTFTTWNEANHQSQPVASRPELVASYHEELTSICGPCTVVAGDVLDSGGYVRWLERFLAASATPPQLWGLHNYGDVTYGRTDGTDRVLAAVPGTLWIEETGGIVALRNAAGRETLAADEVRAARSVDRAFALATTRPRIARMYLYQWKAPVLHRFDAGLLRPDGASRPSYTAVRRNLAAGASPAGATLRWRARWSAIRPSELVLRATCRAADRRCRGRVRAIVRYQRAPGARTQARTIATRSYFTTAARRTATIRIRVTRGLRRRLRSVRTRSLALAVTPARPGGRPARTAAVLPRPR